MDTSTLRLIWDVVEETQHAELVALPDTALIKLLLQRIARKVLLSGEEVCALYNYLSSRLHLIRDIADSRAA
ncbi:MAG: hypothetical protein IGS50_22400 [Synechococcales cyanobacterium C42_A2020_086]|jgi:hypothetical protein|nr:hypothetical protein [Synechococcales cyanobacterium M58_A2018_015]MBF2076490.1 hypothetical protein [Synechococcales cyanobacterium C42_A2020_086]